MKEVVDMIKEARELKKRSEKLYNLVTGLCKHDGEFEYSYYFPSNTFKRCKICGHKIFIDFDIWVKEKELLEVKVNG